MTDDDHGPTGTLRDDLTRQLGGTSRHRIPGTPAQHGPEPSASQHGTQVGENTRIPLTQVALQSPAMVVMPHRTGHSGAATGRRVTADRLLRPISVPLTPVNTGISRLLADSQLRSLEYVRAPEGLDSQADPALTLTGPIPWASTSGERKALERSGERGRLRMSRSLHVTFMLAG